MIKNKIIGGKEYKYVTGYRGHKAKEKAKDSARGIRYMYKDCSVRVIKTLDGFHCIWREIKKSRVVYPR